MSSTKLKPIDPLELVITRIESHREGQKITAAQIDYTGRMTVVLEFIQPLGAFFKIGDRINIVMERS